MKRLNFFILIGMFIFMLSLSAGANETVVKFSLESFSLRNPFKSQLPQKEKKLPVKIKKMPRPVRVFVPKPAPVKPPVYMPPSSQRERRQDNRPKEILKPESPDLDAEITGLIWNSDRPQAIVNGEVLEIGDEINGMKIVSIQKTGIHVKFLQKILKIKMKE